MPTFREMCSPFPRKIIVYYDFDLFIRTAIYLSIYLSIYLYTYIYICLYIMSTYTLSTSRAYRRRIRSLVRSVFGPFGTSSAASEAFRGLGFRELAAEVLNPNH